MAVGFGGLALLVGPQLFGTELNGKYVLGVVIIQVGSFFWQAGSVYSKLRPVGVSPLMASAVQMLWAGVVLTILGTLLGEWPRMHFSARGAERSVKGRAEASPVRAGRCPLVIATSAGHPGPETPGGAPTAS